MTDFPNLRRPDGIPFNEAVRQDMKRRHDRWVDRQAARLGVSPADILAAVLRGWLPELLEAAPNKFALEGKPPPLEGVPDWIDAKIVRDYKAKARAAKDSTDMAVAFHKAKAA